jgi:hypothetical protein
MPAKPEKEELHVVPKNCKQEGRKGVTRGGIRETRKG